jgi:energy-converting hydrogenase A subunit M
MMTKELLERCQARANERYHKIKDEVSKLQKELERKEYELQDIIAEKTDLADCLTKKLYE